METGFFKWLWRFNGLIIAISCVLLLSILLWEMTSDLRRNSFPSRTTNTVAAVPDNVDTPINAPTEISRRFGASTGPQNGTIYALPLYIEQEYPNRGIGKSSGGNIVNYKIIDTDAQTNRWLFAAANRLIVDTDQLFLPHRGTADRHIGYLLSVVETDTNGDNRLSSRDAKSIYLTTPQWAEPVKVTEGALSILRTQVQSPSEFDLIFTTVDGTHAARIGMPTGQIISEQVFTNRD